MNSVFETNSLAETIQIGKELGNRLQNGSGVLLRGEMGAGKTHFTKGIALALGIMQDITSPTFSIVNEYSGKLTLFHFDLYRISDFEDLYAIGFFDYLSQNGVAVIEWSENINWLEKEFEHGYFVSIEKTDTDKRKITINEF